MVTRRHLLTLGASLPLAGLAACSRGIDDDGSPLRLLVPNAPGGGYDTTARLLAGAIARAGDASSVDVFNLPGGSGITGLARLDAERGLDDLMMMMGLGVVGAVGVTGRASLLDGATPVARLLSEPDVVLVRESSSLRRIDDLVESWTRSPSSVLVGGGSLAGGPDHLATYTLAEAVGVPATAVRYRTHDGGGPLLAALLEGRVDVVVSGVLESIDQVRAGAVRALAVTGADRVPGLDTPTLRETGVDTVFDNWRGLLAPPGLSDPRRDRLVDAVATALTTDAWLDATRSNGWTPAWLSGEDFARFLGAEQERTRTLLDELPPDAGG